MSPTALIFFSLPIGMIILLAILIALRLLVRFPSWIFDIIAGFMLLYPPFLLMRAIRADVSRRIFPNRPLATLFLAGGALVNSIILAATMGAAALIIRVISVR